jgi:uroporphyrinogen-III synthase
MVTLPVDADACKEALDGGQVGVVTFASPSAMEALRSEIGPDLFNRLARAVPAAAMGPTTAGALRKAGWRKVSVAEEPTLEALVDAAGQAARASTRD